MSNKHDLSKDIDTIYTNINGLNIELFPSSNIELLRLNVEDFMKYLTECFDLFEEHKNEHDVDEYLITLTKEKNYYNCFIMFDECHDFLSNQDRIKIFWLTYHRHLHHEIDLLTQNKTLINSKYRAIPEIFIEAQPRSKKLFSNTLNYKHYSTFAMRKIDQFSASSIKTTKEVFALYKSGNASHQKSIIRKFFYIFIFGIILASLLFLNLFSSFEKEEIKEEPRQELKEITNIEQVKDSYEGTDSFVIRISLDSKDGYLIYGNYYSVLHFKKFMKNTKSKILSSKYMYRYKKYNIKILYLQTTQEKLSQYFILESQIPSTTDKYEERRLKNKN